MRVHLLLPLGGSYLGGDAAGIVALAQRAEEAGVDGVVLAEHIVMGETVDEYEWGTFPLRPSDPFPEPIVLMSAMAATTSRLTLGTGILIAALRPAALLAKQLATLDQLSNGRTEFGVGTGWHRAELEAHGLDHALRGQLLTDTVRACRSLWGEQPATVVTDSFAFGPVWCRPAPVRRSGPPILFSGRLTARTLRRIVELGDGWIPIMGDGVDAIERDAARLAENYRAAGRDPADLRVRIPLPLIREGGRLSLAATLAGVASVTRPRITDATLPVSAFVRSEADVEPFFDTLASFVEGQPAVADDERTVAPSSS